MLIYNISFSKGIIMISNRHGGETYFTSRYRWIRHLKSKNIVLFTDLSNNLQIIYLSSERFTMCCAQLNVDRVIFMNNYDHFFVYDKNGKNSFYSITTILDQIDKSFSPRITPIFDGSAVLLSERYVVSEAKINSNSIEIRIFDIEMSNLFSSFQMNGRKMMGCQYTGDVFFIYTDIECFYISANCELLLRARIEIIGNFILVQKKLDTGFEVYVFDFQKNEIIYDFRIAGNWIQYNHVLTFDDSTVLRAWTEYEDRAFVVM